jgi:hypothetical protein
MEYPQELTVTITPAIYSRARGSHSTRTCPMALAFRVALESLGFTVDRVDVFDQACTYENAEMPSAAYQVPSEGRQWITGYDDHANGREPELLTAPASFTFTLIQE